MGCVCTNYVCVCVCANGIDGVCVYKLCVCVCVYANGIDCGCVCTNYVCACVCMQMGFSPLHLFIFASNNTLCKLHW